MGFVDDQKGILRQILEEGRRRLAGIAAGEIARVVLDPGATAGGLHHLQVEERALLQPLGLQQLALRIEFFQPLGKLDPDLLDRLAHGRTRRDVMAVGVNPHAHELVCLGAGERIKLDDLLDLIAKERDSPGAILGMRREDHDHVAAHAEAAALQRLAGAAVLQVDQLADERPLVNTPLQRKRDRHRGIGLDRADTVDA